MRATLPALGAAAALAAASLWTPLPRAWVDVPAADASADPRAPSAIAPPSGIVPSVAAGYVQFGAAAGPTGAAPSAAVSAPPPKPGPPVLVGLIGAGQRRIAYILAGGQTTRAALGDRVGAWRVAAIGAHGTTLRSGGRTLTLALYGPRVAPSPPPAVVAAPAATTSAAASPAAPPRSHALEPASAPRASARAPGGPKYWVGPAGSAPPGYVVLKPGEIPPS